MVRPVGSTNKRGAVLQLRRHGTSLMRGLLHDMKELEREAYESKGTQRNSLLNKLIEYKIQLASFIIPKPMAIAAGTLDDEGNIISQTELDRLLEIARTALNEGDTDVQGQTEAEGSSITSSTEA